MDLFTVDNLFTLLMLIFLQAVLGIDNLLYISIESKRVEASQQSKVRRWGIGLAIGLRILLLLLVTKAVAMFQRPFLTYHIDETFEIDMNVHSAIVLAGGLFIMYTAFKEILHMVSIHDVGHAEPEDGPRRSVSAAIAWIVAMNLVFSFDSILSAMALTDVLPVMALAIVLSGVLMMVLADRVSAFLQRNRMYEVLGLFILLVVGVMLVSEGAHLAELVVAGHPIHPMEKSTFYFSITCLVLVDLVQSRYQKKLDLQRARGQRHG